jgi:hypothetical protein
MIDLAAAQYDAFDLVRRYSFPHRAAEAAEQQHLSAVEELCSDGNAMPLSEAIISVRRVARRIMQPWLSGHYAITISWPFRLSRFFISFYLFCGRCHSSQLLKRDRVMSFHPKAAALRSHGEQFRRAEMVTPGSERGRRYS